MSHQDAPQPPETEESLQERFNQLAPQMGLELAKPDESLRCSVGMAIVPMSRPGARLQIPAPTTAGITGAPAPNDEAAILELIKSWESVHPKDLLNKWPGQLTIPFVAIGDRWVDFLDMNDVANALGSAEFQEAQKSFPPFSDTERKVEISKAVVTPLGANRAAVTYYIVEQYKGGLRYGGNSIALVFRIDGAWRVGVFTKHNRGDDMQQLASGSTDRA